MKLNRYHTVCEINVTSLVDVMMVLLIIFMLTAPFIHEGVELKLPKVHAATIKESEAIVISVNREQQIFIDSNRIESSQLAAALTNLKANGADRVFVRADTNVPYGAVMAVIAQVKAVGIVNVGMLTDKNEKGEKS